MRRMRRVPVARLEEGDVFFLYRPRVGLAAVRGRRDVQRFYMILAPRWPRKLYRLFVVGRKKLPAIIPGIQHPEERNWAANIRTSERAADLQDELVAVDYLTRTRGERFVGAAKLVGVGRYQLLRHRNHSELAYALELPEVPGPAQEAFEIRSMASYILALKNPAAFAPGLPQPGGQPAYPAPLLEKFGLRRWIPVDDPALLDYEFAEILLIGARAADVERELGIQIDEEDERIVAAEVCRDLGARYEREFARPLLAGEFPEREEAPPGREEEPSPAKVLYLGLFGPPSAGGAKGGRAAARRAPSAVAFARLLGEIHFPCRREEILAYARQHADRVENPEDAFPIVARLPDRTYTTMADLEVGLSEARLRAREAEGVAPYFCVYCREDYGTRSRFQRHLAAAHPAGAITAADVEAALAGIRFPKRRDELVEYVRRRVPPGAEVLEAVQALPDRLYRDAAEVAIAFGESRMPARLRRPEEYLAAEPPSRRGGRVAAREAVSAAAIAKILGGIDFPKGRAELIEYAGRHRDRVADADGVIAVLAQLPDRPYLDMADVEIEVGKVL